MRWRPAHETHAIERVNLTIRFAEQVPTRAWQPLIESATGRFQGAGFGLVPSPTLPLGMPGFQIMLSAPGVPLAMQTPDALDRGFVLVEGSQAREEALISRQQVVFGVNRYDGWAIFRERFESLLKPLIDKGLENSAIQLVKLEYWDRFTFDGELTETDYSELFFSSSSHMPDFLFHIKEPFHTHVGYFARQHPTKRLINMNVDVVDLITPGSEIRLEGPEVRRSAGIYTMAQDAYPGNSDGHLEYHTVMSQIDEMHSILKKLLADVITEQMSNRISLLQGSQA